jgi:hypothetical protein
MARLWQSASHKRREHFSTLLSSLPDLGGSRNLASSDFAVALWSVAYFRPMKAHGIPAEQLGKMIYNLFAADLNQISKETRSSTGAEAFTPEHIKALQDWASWKLPTSVRSLPEASMRQSAVPPPP